MPLEESQIAAPVSLPTQTPEEAAEGHGTVTMTFAKPVLLTVQDDHIQRKIFFPKGTHQVPLELCDHWYLKAHGAKKEPRNGE